MTFDPLAKGEVACDLVEDFLPNGTALGLSQPSVKCAASLDKCPCRGTQGPRYPAKLPGLSAISCAVNLITEDVERLKYVEMGVSKK